MAEGSVRHLSKGNVEVYSAGTHPSHVHPMAIRVMKELGIDISHHTSKSVNEFLGQDFDVVVTVCDYARAICPVFPGAKNLFHIPFEDPISFYGADEDQLERFRVVRDKIYRTMDEFLKKEFPATSNTSAKFLA